MDWQQAFQERDDLIPFGAEGMGVFALGLRFGLEDLQTVANESITDGPDDKKIDVIYVDRNQRSAFIMQCYGSTSKFDEQAPGNKATDLHTAASYALSVGVDNIPERIRPQIKDLRLAITDGSFDTIYFWYVHNRTESDNIGQELKQVEISAQANLRLSFPNSDCTVISQEVGRKTLADWFSQRENQILVEDTLTFGVQPKYELSGRGWECLVTSISGNELHSLYKRYGKELFSMNVRDYLGIVNKESNVNNNIRTTAVKEPDQFWAYNNGLTIITHDYESNDQNLIVKGIAIVNGAQTTGAMGNLSSQPAPNLKIAARFYKTSDQEFVENIIRYTNNQNAVEAADFRSTDSIQRRLKEEFSKIPNADYNGGRRGNAGDKITRNPDLLPNYTVGQALSAFHGDPVIAYNEKSKIWIDNEAYSKVFKDDTTADHIVFVFSLLRAIENRKQSIVTLRKADGDLTQQQEQEMLFHRVPGSQFYIMSIIAACLEVVTNQPLPNRFRVQWKSSSLQDGIIKWDYILSIVLSFSQMLALGLQDGLKGIEKVRLAETQVRQTLSSIRPFHADAYEKFSKDLLIKI